MDFKSLKKVIGLGKNVKKEHSEGQDDYSESVDSENAKSHLDKYDAENYEQDNVSFVEGEKSPIKGVKRPVVLGIGAIFITTFVVGMLYGFSSDTPKQHKQEESTGAMSDSAIESMSPTKEQVSRLAQYNQKNNGNEQNKTLNPAEAKKLQQVNRANSNQSRPDFNNRENNNSYNPNQYRQLPTIPQQRYNSFPYAALQMQPPAAPAASADSKADESVVEKVKDTFNSAIAFALGGKTGNNSVASSGDTGNETQPVVSTSSGSYSNAGSMSYIPVSSSMIQAGTLIPAILATGVNTDAGDMVQAQVTSNIYDSLTGSTLLIPAGSKLLGTYKAGNNGRVNIDWQTLIVQDYGSWNLDGSMVAVDNMGYAGLEGHVNSHAGKVLTAGSIATGLAAVAGIAGGNSGVSNNSYSYGQLAAQGAMSNFLNTASSFFQKSIDTAETITIEPGYQFNIFVTQAISF